MTPALRAIREHFPDCALHVLVPEEVAPILNHLPWLTRVWPMPRQRGRARFKQTWPIIRALRDERFDRSVDFGGNDRGAILSPLCGARRRLGPIHPRGVFGRRLCFNQRGTPPPLEPHETLPPLHTLSAWGIRPPRSLAIEIRTDPALDAFAAQLLPERKVICHLAAGQPKKEWPTGYWATLYHMAAAAGLRLVFTTGTGAHELSLVDELKRLVPDAPVLPAGPHLPALFSGPQTPGGFLSRDPRPPPFPPGVGVPTTALFSPP